MTIARQKEDREAKRVKMSRQNEASRQVKEMKRDRCD